MPSFLDIESEKNRQNRLSDTRFKQVGRHVFILRGPAGNGPLAPAAGPGGITIARFPLVINPDTYEYRLPFAAEVTGMPQGGVVSEEGGIVIGSLRLAGTTGFKVRQNIGEVSYSAGDGEFTGLDNGRALISNTGDPFGGVTGHMHLWRLANRCFDGYSALKKDPKTAHQTTMEYHNIKDDTHVQIIPREFTIERNASKERVTYRYNIRADVVGPAQRDYQIINPDQGLLDSFRDTIGKIRNSIQSGAAAIDDINASMDAIRRTIASAPGIIDDMSSVIDSMTNLVDGTRRFTDIPKAFINNLSGVAESAADLAVGVVGFPADVAQSFLEIADTADRMAVASRSHFKEGWDEISRKYERVTTGYQEGRDPAIDERVLALSQEAAEGQGRMRLRKTYGSDIRPGDLKRGRVAPIQSRARLQRFQGFEERVVNSGDTLQSMAAKYMGNANDWLAIAEANNLRAPYITLGAKMPGTLAPGDRIIIPKTQSLGIPDTLTTGEPTLGKSQAASLLGTDIELERRPDGLYDWAIDTARGSVDARTVSGVPNLEQAIGARLRTEQGHNILYPEVGLPRTVGDNARADDLVELEFEARRQFLQDPRVKRVSSLQIEINQDQLELNASVVPIGFTSTRVISQTLT